jgi:hypothetical protein
MRVSGGPYPPHSLGRTEGVTSLVALTLIRQYCRFVVQQFLREAPFPIALRRPRVPCQVRVKYHAHGCSDRSRGTIGRPRQNLVPYVRLLIYIHLSHPNQFQFQLFLPDDHSPTQSLQSFHPSPCPPPMRIHLRHGLPLTHRTIHRTMRLTRLRLTRKARKRPLLAGRSRHTQRTQLKRPRFDRSAPSQRKNDGGNAED